MYYAVVRLDSTRGIKSSLGQKMLKRLFFALAVALLMTIPMVATTQASVATPVVAPATPLLPAAAAASESITILFTWADESGIHSEYLECTFWGLDSVARGISWAYNNWNGTMWLGFFSRQADNFADQCDSEYRWIYNWIM